MADENDEKQQFGEPIYNKDNYRKFCELEVDWEIKSIDSADLPAEFSEETCEFLDLFRRKTVNENTEWNFYIDYENNEIIHCLHGQATTVKDRINVGLMQDRKILTIHNHPKGTYSAPSPNNFEILEHEFENFEIICAENEFWILESKGEYDKEFIEELKTKIENLFYKCDHGIYDTKKIPYDANIEYNTRLAKYINNLKTNINLIKMEYR